jgi:chorismate synthase
MLRFLTAGESHGKALVAILEGMPAGLRSISMPSPRNSRGVKAGAGRGRRMAIESDRAEALSGVRHGVTTGAPIALVIPNKDWENWQKTMHVEPVQPEGNRRRPARSDAARPGHADLAGS